METLSSIFNFFKKEVTSFLNFFFAMKTYSKALEFGAQFNTRFNNHLGVIIVLVFYFFISNGFGQTSQSITTAGNGTWTCPTGVTSVTINCWGGGGGGSGTGGGTSGNSGAGCTSAGYGNGGAGGSYSTISYSVTPGTTYKYTVGAAGTAGTNVAPGGAGGTGGSTYFGNSVAGNSSDAIILANGGTGAGVGSGSSSAASNTTGCLGTTFIKGGNGSGYAGSSSGAGGAGSGSSGTAANASGTTGGVGVNGGGTGGAGRTTNGDGNAGSQPGGGGSGGRNSSATCRAGGAGGKGKIEITYTCPSAYSYATLPFTESFETWMTSCTNTGTLYTNDMVGSDQSTYYWKNSTASGNTSWRRTDATVANSGWGSLSGSYSPVFSAGSYSARFHSFNATSGLTGSIDLYLNFNTSGDKLLTFDYINASGTDVLNVYLSTDGGATFGSSLLLCTTSGTGVWSSKSVSVGSSISTTCVVRFTATSDYGATDIGVDNLSIVASCSSPTNQATTFTYPSIGEKTMTLGWTRGNGNNVMIVAREGGVPTDPTSGTTYTANAAYGSGTACGGGFVVYSGIGTSVNLTSLLGNKTYNFAAYEFSTTGTCYNMTQLTGTSTTLDQETWVGGTSIDWATASNWSSSYVPLATTNVTIPTGTTFAPTISASSYAVCKNLTINSSATLTENAPGLYYFSIYGNITCNGTFISNTMVELNGGLVSDYATISGSGDMSSLHLDLGWDVNIGYYKLLNDITLEQFYLDSYYGNSIFDMNGYNLIVGFFDVESSTTFYQKTGILSIEDPAPTIDNTSFVEATGTTYFSSGTIWVATSDQIIPSITYYNLKVRANNGYTATIGSGSAFSVTGDLTVLNPSTAGGVVSLVENVTVSGNTLIGTSGNALTLNLSKRIIGTGTFTMGNVAAHAINISFAHATNFAITSSIAPTFYGTATYTSASDQKVITATSYNNLVFDLAGTKTLFGNLDVNGNLTLTDGTFVVSTFNVNLAGDFVKQTAATFTANTATFTLDGAATQYVNVTAAAGTTACNADITFYNLVIDGSDVKIYYNKTNDRKYNTNDFTVNSGKQVSFISQ